MRVEYRQCRPQHFECLDVQEGQKEELAVMLANTSYAEIACSHVAISAWLGNRCLGAAGFVPLFPHRAVAWSLVSQNIGTAMVDVTRKIRNILAADPTPRIEMTVDVDFEAGHKWAKLIGMTLETPIPLRKFGARGEDELMYVRIK